MKFYIGLAIAVIVVIWFIVKVIVPVDKEQEEADNNNPFSNIPFDCDDLTPKK